ncbi:MAG TPA: M15 family metallopeptidase, partial [Polyangiaceae bacterium]|nr:M15 family metallopeptidase [Polyangiaceae bacterium]
TRPMKVRRALAPLLLVLASSCSDAGPDLLPAPLGGQGGAAGATGEAGGGASGAGAGQGGLSGGAGEAGSAGGAGVAGTGGMPGTAGAGAGGGGAAGAPETWPAPASMIWVNPSRCYVGCALPPVDIVNLDALGRELVGECVCLPGGPPSTCPVDCCPRVARAAQPALAALLAALQAAGRPSGIESGYRDYGKQKCLFNQFASEKGRAARPGHSEHETGLAVDVKTDPSGYAWLAEHVHEFGFALSFPEGKQKLTGFRPEPWHVRYVGSRVALAIREGGLTPEEYFRQHPAETSSGDCNLCPDLALSTPACGEASPAGACLGANASVLTFCYEDGIADSDPRYLAEVDCAVTGARCVVEAEGARCTGNFE